MKGWQRLSKSLLAFALCFTGVFSGFQANVKAAVDNLAQGKTVTASNAYSTMPASNLTDGDEGTRWSSESPATQWAYVDLGETKTMNKFEMKWESDGVYASSYNIYVSDDKDNWGTAVVAVTGSSGQQATAITDKAVSGRYVKLEVTKMEGYNSVSCYEFKIFNDPDVAYNIALDAAVTDQANTSADNKAKLTDGNETTRWSSEVGAPQWVYVDLGESKTMNKFETLWESDAEYAKNYNIYVSNDTTNWGDPVAAVANNTKRRSVAHTEAVTGRYVKLEVTAVSAYPNVSCNEFKIYNELDVPQDPTENIALGKNAVASSQEAASVRAELAVDGNSSSSTSRWGSNLGDNTPWIYVDLGKVLDVKTIKLFWENRKATAYKIQIAETISNPTVDDDWTTVKSFNARPSDTNDKIVLDDVKQARYVRVYIDSFTADDPDGGVTWGTVSLYEIEIYGGEIKATLDDVANAISVNTPSASDTKLTVNIPNEAGYTIAYNGTDLEQVVDRDLNIFKPIVDKRVNVSFKITDEVNNTYRFKEIPVTIPGKNAVDASDNAAPNILPELQEWKGTTGRFSIAANPKVVYTNDKLKGTAETFAKEYSEITGKTMAVVKGSSANAGEILLSLTNDTSKGLMDEGYLMEITDKVTVEAETATGAVWATKTILQSIQQTGDIPCGITRDYPLYKVRGIILDVGRKTFTMDYLEQVVKMMSWYKMNDFQIHLNDNLIPLENLKTEDKIMQAYSAFRLESNIKKGGNNGKNQADLTSTDVFYTKDEFRNLIKDSRSNYGVNIVPEIDTPAHSLALTKVRPDLRLGTSGRQNDHLDLADQYEECLSFVQSIFSEYMTGNDPVFDSETIVQVGADEYTASPNAYRRFANDMLKYVADSGRQARIWGSLTSIKGDVEVRGEGYQMNLWNGGWADMKEMYDLGFDLINCNDGQYYIVPNAGYYYDYLNDNTLYNNDINRIGSNYVPAGDEKMIGGAFAVWNDMTDYLENGISEYDVYDRIKTPTALFGAKLWGKGGKTLEQAKSTATQLGDGPDTNFGYEVESKSDAIVNYPLDDMSDASGNSYDLSEGVNAEIAQVDGKNALRLNGGESYVNTPLTTIGLNNDLRVKVKRTSSRNDEQILFESDYGTFKAVQKETGKVGFTRENRDYSFDYTLPVNEWVELEFKNQQNIIELYVNGTKVDALGDGEKVEGRPLLATAMFPIARIGSKENAFIGYIDDLRIGTNDTFNSTMSLDYALMNANAVENVDEELSSLIDQAKALLKEYAPAASDIQQLTKAINDKLDSMEFAKADYSAVDKYLALVPQDKSIFTDESVARLETVINSIRRDLPASMQATVDGYAKSLAAALQALEIKNEKNVDYIDSSTITATASSFQPDGSNPEKAIDGDPNTIWHTDWSITSGDHWINFEMATKSNVNGLTYVPRSNGGNGTATQYEIQVSDDGQTYRAVKSGNLAQSNEAKVIEFETVNTKHVRFVIKKGVGGNGSAAEIMLHNADADADVDGLNTLIQQAEAIANDGFTATSWQALQDKIAEAKTLAGQTKPTANDVEIMKRELSKAMTALEYPAEKSALKDLIQKAEALVEKNYTAETWAKLRDMLAEAKTIDADENATQETVDIIVEKLQEAIDNLVKVSDEQVDKSELSTLLNTAKAIDTTKYTEATVMNLNNHIAAAEAILANEEATQKQVDDAVASLKQAIEDLEEAEMPIKDVELKDTEKGVTVNAPADVIDPNTVLHVLEVEEVKNISESIKETLSAIDGKYTAFDIKLLLNGKVVQPNGMITISMLVPKGYDMKKCGLYHISDDGKMNEVEFTLQGNKIVFETDHLSVYALVQYNESIDEPNKPTDPIKPTDPSKPTNPIQPNKPIKPNKPGILDNNQTLKPVTSTDKASTPNTGDHTMFTGYAWLTLCAGVVVLAAYKKHQKETK